MFASSADERAYTVHVSHISSHAFSLLHSINPHLPKRYLHASPCPPLPASAATRWLVTPSARYCPTRATPWIGGSMHTPRCRQAPSASQTRESKPSCDSASGWLEPSHLEASNPQVQLVMYACHTLLWSSSICALVIRVSKCQSCCSLLPGYIGG